MESLKPALLLPLLLAACEVETGVEPSPQGEPEAPASEPVEETAAEPVPLSEREVLIRASLDLRGIRPSAEEFEQLEEDPEALEALIDGFFAYEGFGERIIDLFAPVYDTRMDVYGVYASEYGLDDQASWAQAVGEEPLRVLAYIVENDLPFYEIAVADWTLVNEHLAGAWPVDYFERYGEDATGWRQAWYTDGRPAAGVLSTNGFWWRYGTSSANANRGRANAISKVLLCTDYLERPIEFARDVNLLDGNAVDEALKTNPGCVACHYSLDPLSSYLWGFFYYSENSIGDMTYYHPEREFFWQEYGGEVEPGYYGHSGETLDDLGEQIASDSELANCMVEHSMEQLLGREMSLEDTSDYNTHREVFLQDLTVKPLLRSVIDSDTYRSRFEDDQHVVAKLMTPELMATAISDLTGFSFSYDGYDLMRTDSYGLHDLSAADDPSATMVLSFERLTQAAALYVTERDRDDQSEPRLFTEIHFTETPETDLDAMSDQIQALHFRLFGTRVAHDGPEVEANLALWQDLYAIESDTSDAWAGLLSVLLRDPDFLFY